MMVWVPALKPVGPVQLYWKGAVPLVVVTVAVPVLPPHAVGVEVFAPATTNALMAALWVHDLRWPQAAANPARALGHPYELFTANACHGGLWRIAYQPRSALPFAAALGWARQRLGLAST